MKFTHDMMQKYDINKITLEQQIYLMKVNDNIKEKAMIKLKEVKSKSDETGAKAKQYLDGLTKIPFGIYKEEPVLKKVKEMNVAFLKTITNYENITKDLSTIKKDKYTNIEMVKFIKNANNNFLKYVLDDIKTIVEKQSLKQLNANIQHINVIKKNKKEVKITVGTKQKNIEEIFQFLNTYKNEEKIIMDFYDSIKINSSISLSKTITEMNTLKTNIQTIDSTMNSITEALDESIYGHAHAKNQILKIIGQWMNGEQCGYSFGFEGSPGIGKTSLAKKGLANCLKDENGTARPYSFIALGGSCNGSTLEGHGYTYVNSS